MTDPAPSCIGSNQSIPLLILLVLAVAICGCNPPSDNSSTSPESGSTLPSQNTTEISTSSKVTKQEPAEHQIKDKPVSVTFKISQKELKPEESAEISIILKMAPFWEIRTMNATPEMIATRFELELPEGFQTEGDWKTPEIERSASPDGHSVYTGEAVFRQKLNVLKNAQPGEYPVQCKVHYQACNDRICLKPKEVNLEVTLQVE